MNKKRIKLAIIRKEGEQDHCPFGLSILDGCKNAGDLIEKMAPLMAMGEDSSEEEQQAIKMANNHLLRWQSPGTKCKYADKIIDAKNAVDCNYGTNTAGESGAGFEGSPWYARYMNAGVIGGNSPPTYIGILDDNTVNKAPYYGPYSIESVSCDDDDKKDKKSGHKKE